MCLYSRAANFAGGNCSTRNTTELNQNKIIRINIFINKKGTCEYKVHADGRLYVPLFCKPSQGV